MSVLTACGKNYYFAGRNLPPSGVLNRVLVAVQNPSALAQGELLFDDAFYDIRHSYNNQTNTFSISGYSGKLPVSIQNMPEEQQGAVYAIGDGSLTVIDYSGEKVKSTFSASNLGGISQSVFVSRDLNYAYAAAQSSHSLTVYDHGSPVSLNLPGVYRVSVNPGNTVVLAFVQNTNNVYSLVHLNDSQRQAAVNNPNWNGAVDCEPQNLPT